MRCALAISLLMLAACRQEQQPRIEISDAWARPVAVADGPAAAYMTIANKGGPDRLTAVGSDRGESAGLHSSRMSDGIMEMRPLTEGIAVPGHGQITLAPNSMHVMLMKAGPLKEGDRFRLTLNFEKSGPIEATVVVRGNR
jgi:copper(I)-binding protein